MDIRYLRIGDEVCYQDRKVTVKGLHESGRVEILDGITFKDVNCGELQPDNKPPTECVFNEGSPIET